MKVWFRENKYFTLATIELVVTGVYFFLGVYVTKHITYLGVDEELNYWFLILFTTLNWLCFFTPFIFLIVLGKFIGSLSDKKDGAVHKSLGIASALLFVSNLMFFLVSFNMSFSHIDHRSSIKVDKHIYNLASRNENEYGFRYYIYQCPQWDLSFDFSCKQVATFLSDQDLYFYAETVQTELLYDFTQNMLYVVWDNKIIYEFMLEDISNNRNE